MKFLLSNNVGGGGGDGGSSDDAVGGVWIWICILLAGLIFGVRGLDP